jgi:hypothetical protein
MKTITTMIMAFLFVLVGNVAMAQKIEIMPTSTLKGPQGVVANAVIDLSKSAGFEITATQKNSCGEAVDYFENAKGPVAIVWSDSMIKNTAVTKQNCIINFEKASAVAVTYAPYEVCVLKGTKLEPNKTYKLGNNKFNPKGSILQHLNTNNIGIKFTDVTYDSSAAVVTGLLNKEIEVGYTATGNVSSAVKSGSIDCLYTTGSTKYGQKMLSEFTEKSQLNDYKLGMMVFTKNLSAEQVDRLQKSLQKVFATSMTRQDMVGSKVAPNKADIDQFIDTAKVYATYN